MSVIENTLPKRVGTDTHGVIGGRLITEIGIHLKADKFGWIFIAGTDYQLPGMPRIAPDVSFVSKTKHPALTDNEVITVAPDLAAIIIDRFDKWYEVVDKMELLIEMNGQLVWVIDPYNKAVFVQRPQQPLQLLHQSDELDGENVLPGFKLKVSELF